MMQFIRSIFCLEGLIFLAVVLVGYFLRWLLLPYVIQSYVQNATLSLVSGEQCLSIKLSNIFPTLIEDDISLFRCVKLHLKRHFFNTF